MEQYQECIAHIPPSVLKGWKRRCNSQTPMRSHFVAFILGDFVTPADTLTKRIKRIELRQAKDLPPTSDPTPDKPSTLDKNLRSPLPSPSFNPRDINSLLNASPVQDTKSDDANTRPLESPAPVTILQEEPKKRALGRVEVCITLDDNFKVMESRQSSHTVPQRLLTTGVTPGCKLYDAYIFFRSSFWAFEQSTRFVFTTDGEEHEDGPLYEHALSTGEEPGADGNISTTLFNFPFARFLRGRFHHCEY